MPPAVPLRMDRNSPPVAAAFHECRSGEASERRPPGACFSFERGVAVGASVASWWQGVAGALPGRAGMVVRQLGHAHGHDADPRCWQQHRALSGRGGSWAWRYGCRVSGDGCAAGTQVALKLLSPEYLAMRDCGRASCASRAWRPDRPRRCHPGLRGRRGRRAAVHRDALRRRHRPGRLLRARAARPCGRRTGRAAGRRARCRARARAGAPRRQAVATRSSRARGTPSTSTFRTSGSARRAAGDVVTATGRWWGRSLIWRRRSSAGGAGRAARTCTRSAACCSSASRARRRSPARRKRRSSTATSRNPRRARATGALGCRGRSTRCSPARLTRPERRWASGAELVAGCARRAGRRAEPRARRSAIRPPAVPRGGGRAGAGAGRCRRACRRLGQRAEPGLGESQRGRRHRARAAVR